MLRRHGFAPYEQSRLVTHIIIHPDYNNWVRYCRCGTKTLRVQMIKNRWKFGVKGGNVVGGNTVHAKKISMTMSVTRQ